MKTWKEVYKNEYVLCSTDSNAAADRLMSSLIQAGVHCVRIGHAVDYCEDVHRHMRQLPEYKGYTKDFAMWRKRSFQKAAIERWGVAVITCISCGHESVEKIHWGNVIMDECTQSLLPSTLVPLSLGARRVVLLGDHKQLPPTIIDKELQTSGYQRTLFERLSPSDQKNAARDSSAR